MGNKIQVSEDVYQGRQRRLQPAGSRTLYHQTSPDAAKAIIASQQMNRGSQGSLGGGIYFAQSPADTDRKAVQKGVILVCEVRLGNTKVVAAPDPSITFAQLLKGGHDSVMTNFFQTGPEFVVYNVDQVTSIRKYSEGGRLPPLSLLGAACLPPCPCPDHDVIPQNALNI